MDRGKGAGWAEGDKEREKIGKGNKHLERDREDRRKKRCREREEGIKEEK